MEIVEKYYKENRSTLVKRMKWRTYGNESDAEDVVQEAFYRACRFLKGYNPQIPFGIWFSAVLSNAYKEWRNKEYHHSCTEEFDEEQAEPCTIKAENLEQLSDIFARVMLIENSKEREMLRLHYLIGLSQRDVAKIMDCKYKEVYYVTEKFRKELRSKRNENLY